VLLVLLAAIALGADGTREGPGPEHFLRSIRSLHEPIRDIAFVFEGERRYVGPEGMEGGDPSRLDYRFQGNYALRADGSTFIEIYRSRFDNAPGQHFIKTLYKGEVREAFELPGVADWRKRVASKPGGPGSLNGLASPSNYIFLHFFEQFRSPEDLGYLYQGWEEVDGRNCLRVQLDIQKNNPNPHRPFLRFWIDMQRGGHPLKAEAYRGDVLLWSVNDVVLKEYPEGGSKTIWIPTRAHFNEYSWNGQFHNKPILQETNYIVDGSLLFNQDLPDATFIIDPKGQPPHGIRGLRKTEGGPSGSLKRPRQRTDPEGVKQRLEEQLAEADRQARILDASAAAREEQGKPTMLAYSIAAIGISILCGSLLWSWRRR
jgi:hypothetical protein